LIKTILAWLTAQIQYQIRLHVGSATLDPAPRLHSTQLAADDVASGSHYANVSATGHWHGMPNGHGDIMLMSWWHHPYPGLACSSGRLVFGLGQPVRVKKTRVARVYARGQPPRRRVCARDCWSDFEAVFTSGFVSSSFTQWCGQNTILTTFIFEQKSNTTLNHQLWYQL